MISIILRVWQRPQRTIRAIESVLKQTHSDFECLIIGDCDPDFHNYQDIYHDPRLHFFNMPMREEGAWGTAPMNLGIEMAQRPYLLTLDNDDALLPNHIATRLDFILSKPEVNFTFHNTRVHTGFSSYIRGDGTLRLGMTGFAELTVKTSLAKAVGVKSKIYGHDYTFIQDMIALGGHLYAYDSGEPTYIVHRPIDKPEEID